MADNTTTTEEATTEKAYVSDEMKQILADIEAQDKLIEEARAAKKSLQAAKRRQARLDEKERERRAREKEQRDALALWRALHNSNVRLKDGTTMNAYELVTSEVTPHLVMVGPSGSEGATDSAHGDGQTDTSVAVARVADSGAPEGA